MKICVFGDSISQGIGKLKRNYCQPLKEKLSTKFGDVVIDNFAHTGKTIKYMKDIINSVGGGGMITPLFVLVTQTRNGVLTLLKKVCLA